MKGIIRAIAAVTLTATLAACGADPLGPGSQEMAPTVSANLVLASPTIGGTAPASTTCGSTGVLSEASTYVVAYGENATSTGCSTTSAGTTACGSTGEWSLSSASTYVVAYGDAPTTSSTCTVAAPAPSDSTPLRLSFP
jgi:hypothetical protein